MLYYLTISKNEHQHIADDNGILCGAKIKFARTGILKLNNISPLSEYRENEWVVVSEQNFCQSCINIVKDRHIKKSADSTPTPLPAKRHNLPQYITESKAIIKRELPAYLVRHYTSEGEGFLNLEQLILNFLNHIHDLYKLSLPSEVWFDGSKRDLWQKSQAELIRYIEYYTIYKTYVIPVIEARRRARSTYINHRQDGKTTDLLTLYNSEAFPLWKTHIEKLLQAYSNKTIF